MRTKLNRHAARRAREYATRCIMPASAIVALYRQQPAIRRIVGSAY